MPHVSHEGKSYAVFVSGDLAVNATIQDPVSTLTEQFVIDVPLRNFELPNTAPRMIDIPPVFDVTVNQSKKLVVG